MHWKPVLQLVIVLALTGPLLWNALRYFRQALQTRRWPSTEGTVISKRVAQWIRQDDPSPWTLAYRPRITYEYEVEGEPYHRTGYDPLGVPGSRRWARSVAARYRTGESCTVYRDPADPARSALAASAGLWPNVFAGAVALVSLGLLAWAACNLVAGLMR